MRLAGPHKSAILDFAWNNSLVVSGDKDGYVAFWVEKWFLFIKCTSGYQQRTSI